MSLGWALRLLLPLLLLQQYHVVYTYISTYISTYVCIYLYMYVCIYFVGQNIYTDYIKKKIHTFTFQFPQPQRETKAFASCANSYSAIVATYPQAPTTLHGDGYHMIAIVCVCVCVWVCNLSQTFSTGAHLGFFPFNINFISFQNAFAPSFLFCFCSQIYVTFTAATTTMTKAPKRLCVIYIRIQHEQQQQQQPSYSMATFVHDQENRQDVVEKALLYVTQP